MQDKLLSIITVVLNIEDTIKNVLSCKTDQCEFIVLDGKSTDNTCSIIEKYLDNIDVYISEPDNGIYDAMNKGIAKANGKWLYFINVGDELMNIPIEILSASINDKLLCFPVFINRKKLLLPRFNKLILIKNTLPHQGCFYRNDNFEGYNLAYSIFSDYQLNLHYYKMKMNVKCFKSPPIASHTTDGVSNSKKSVKEFYSLVLNENGFLCFLLSILYFKIRGVKYKLFN